MKKLLKGIAYCESTETMCLCSELPEEFGKIYDFAKNSAAVGHKFALILRDAGFGINDCEQVFINFTPALAEGVYEVSDRRLQRWQCYVNYGLDPGKLKEIPAKEHAIFLTAATEKVLSECFAQNEAEKKMIHEAAQSIVMYGEKLEIDYLLKRDKNFDAAVGFNLLNDGTCRIILTVKDLEGHVLQKREIAHAESYEDALDHAGTILVRKNRVVVKPKNNLHTKNVQPLEVILGEE